MNRPAPSATLALALAILGSALAGCVAPATPTPGHAAQDAPPAATATPAPGAPGSTGARAATPPAADPDPGAPLDAPPRLVRGEWWRIRFTSGLFGETPDLVRVVADVQEQGYVVGMPHEGWFKEAIAYHAPGFGDVGFDLSYEMHGGRFEPLRFPLVEGATWETSFSGQALVATVESAEGPVARVRLTPPPSEGGLADPLLRPLAPFDPDVGVTLVYDARQREIVEFESVLGRWEVVEHGFDFAGWVTIPRAHEAVILHGQFLAATPGEPVVTRTQVVEGGYNRLTLLQAIVALAPGAYRVRAVSPAGAEMVTESLATRGFTARFHEVVDPDGAWTLEDVVGGAGLTYSMGLAYHQYDIRLPDGAIRADHSHKVIR